MPKFVLGERYAHSLSTRGAISIYMVFFYLMNTAAYFAVFSFLAFLFRASDIIQLPLAVSNAASVILLSIKMPKWRFGEEIENFPSNAGVAVVRWCIVVSLPAAFMVTAVLFTEPSFSVQLMVVLVNSFHLECMLLFAKTARKNS